jgi:hypothetical protein
MHRRVSFFPGFRKANVERHMSRFSAQSGDVPGYRRLVHFGSVNSTAQVPYYGSHCSLSLPGMGLAILILYNLAVRGTPRLSDYPLDHR